MAFTGYLKIEGIDGESKRADHEGEIDCWGVSFSAQQMSSSSVGSGRTRGRATLSDFTFYKTMDAASPYLMLACTKGKSFAEIVFTVRKDSGDEHLDYLTVTLTNCIISSYQMGQTSPEEDSSQQISEVIGVSYEKINMLYKVQADDHSKGDDHEVEYDLVGAK
jgi:type VI secretion system secreted protein Hcp